MKDGEVYITKLSLVTFNSIYKIRKIIKKIIVNSTICLEGLLPIPTDHVRSSIKTSRHLQSEVEP